MERQDWPNAAHWYSKVTEATEGGLTTWIDLAAAWHLLTSRCLSPEPTDIAANDLRDPWHCFQNERLDVLRWHGAVSTAIALHRLGHDDLADRFVAWAHAERPHRSNGEVRISPRRSRATNDHHRPGRRPRDTSRRGVRCGRASR